MKKLSRSGRGRNKGRNRVSYRHTEEGREVKLGKVKDTKRKRQSEMQTRRKMYRYKDRQTVRQQRENDI